MRIIDLDQVNGVIDWTPAFDAKTARSCRGLLQALEKQAVDEVGALAVAAIKPVIGAGYTLLGNHHGDEAEVIANAIGLPSRDVVLANLAYDLTQAAGCSTFVVPGSNGPIHARTLDWEFPRGHAQKHSTVYRVSSGAAVDYAIVGWPGLFGAFTAIAPGRFSVTVNYVQNDSHGPIKAAANAVTGDWPVPWLVRHVLDTAENFEAAVAQLRREPLISPVLFTVAGTKNTERVVIERAPAKSRRRQGEGRRPLITANVYQHDDFLEANTTADCDGCNGHGTMADDSVCDDCDGSGLEYCNDSVQRIEYLHEALTSAPPTTPREALEILDDGQGLITYANTQHAVAMCARTGELWVRVPGQRPIQVPL